MSNTPPRSPGVSPGSSSAAYDRQTSWSRALSARHATERERIKREEVSGCTFRPETNAMARTYPADGGGGGGGG
ncbi:hypothetical protein TrRE_jg5049, partial [Triparma retinervis]